MDISASIVTALLASLLLIGCDGGLQGTGVGPSDPKVLCANLSQQVQPNIRQSLQVAGDDDSAEHNVATIATSWDRLSPVFSTVERLRLAAQEELVLLNSIFAELKSECPSVSTDPCVVAAGTLNAPYSTAITSRLIQLESIDGTSLTTQQRRWLEAVKAREGSD